MFIGEYKNKNVKIWKQIICVFIIVTIFSIFFKIKEELAAEKVASLNLLKKNKEMSSLDLKNTSDMGWFNLKHSIKDYERDNDIVFLCFQYMVVPTVLENNGYNKKIICYYTSPEQLADFCKKKKNYKLIAKDIFDYFALFERID